MSKAVILSRAFDNIFIDRKSLDSFYVFQQEVTAIRNWINQLLLIDCSARKSLTVGFQQLVTRLGEKQMKATE